MFNRKHYLYEYPQLENGVHWHFKDTKKIKEFMSSGKRGDPITATASIVAIGVVTAAGTTAYQAHEEKKAQKKALSFQEEQQAKLLSYQEAQVKAAEEKVAGAEALAKQTAAEELKRKRRAQTQTILTSPLGIYEEASLGFSTLLGGGR